MFISSPDEIVYHYILHENEAEFAISKIEWETKNAKTNQMLCTCSMVGIHEINLICHLTFMMGPSIRVESSRYARAIESMPSHAMCHV